VTRNIWNDLGFLFLLALRVIALFLHALTCAVSARAECNSTRFTFEMSKERRKVCRVPATLSGFVHAHMSVV
jgi:hypothetical protein